MKNKFFLILTFTVSCIISLSASSSVYRCPKLSTSQIHVLQDSYKLGQPHDLGYTLAALAFKESTAGKYKINAISRDFGIFQGNVETICKQAGVFHNSFLCNVEIQNVVNDIDLAAKHAIDTLTYWNNYHNNRAVSHLVYEKTIRSYNAGFSFNKATKYWTDFRLDFHMIKQCVDFSEI